MVKRCHLKDFPYCVCLYICSGTWPINWATGAVTPQSYMSQREAVCFCCSLWRWEAGSLEAEILMDDDKFMWLVKKWSPSKQTLHPLTDPRPWYCPVEKLLLSLKFDVLSKLNDLKNWIFVITQADKMVKTGPRFSCSGPVVATMRVWSFWCWRRYTVPSNLFIALRFLLYFSSIFH